MLVWSLTLLSIVYNTILLILILFVSFWIWSMFLLIAYSKLMFFFLIPNSICRSFSPYPSQYLLFVYICFLLITTLTGMKWYFIVFMCIFLISRDMEHLFMWLYVIFEKCLCRSSAHFLIGLFIFWYWVVCVCCMS